MLSSVQLDFIVSSDPNGNLLLFLRRQELLIRFHELVELRKAEGVQPHIMGVVDCNEVRIGELLRSLWLIPFFNFFIYLFLNFFLKPFSLLFDVGLKLLSLDITLVVDLVHGGIHPVLVVLIVVQRGLHNFWSFNLGRLLGLFWRQSFRCPLISLLKSKNVGLNALHLLLNFLSPFPLHVLVDSLRIERQVDLVGELVTSLEHL